MAATSPAKPASHPAPCRARTPRPSAGRARRAGYERLLGAYAERPEDPRELVLCGAGGRLLVDRSSRTRGDQRLLAELADDEPLENAEAICRQYLAEPPARRRGCRAPTAENAAAAGSDDLLGLADAAAGLDGDPLAAAPLRGRRGRFSLELRHGAMSIPELRWCRRAWRCASQATPVCLRDVVAELESYDPACAITAGALLDHTGREDTSTVTLQAEYKRLRNSPIVLNRALREAVLAALEREQLSMSEIAIRCGRVKRDRRGNRAGETSWLARRLGLLAEAGRDTPTPWIHSDVLALIAREGLGLSPREVEL
ncbi:MAG TPA: hypothetical protein VL979_06800 [Solirubrobacteraceae bacterium]|nr:hypothetical protein [Solirubrobacteraceae bacterium]